MENKKNFYIDGKWVSPKGKEEIKVINPATEENCAVISLGNKEDIDLAFSSAKRAYSSWSFSTKEERIKLLEKLYDNYKKRWADMDKILSWALKNNFDPNLINFKRRREKKKLQKVLMQNFALIDLFKTITF